MKNVFDNELYKRYLTEVKGLKLEGGCGMTYKIKFKKADYKYEVDIDHVRNKKEAIEKLKRYVGNDEKLKICSIKVIEVWQKIIIPKGV